jgi:uncharacterized protein YuzE
MEISYDKDADAIYISFLQTEFSKNKKIDDFTILDLDNEGKVIGIELLEVSKRLPKDSISQIKVNNLVVAE